MKNMAANLSPCERCGACCATFRVDFSIMETQAEGGAVPDGLALPVTASTCRLRGTDHLPPRCAALSGRVGERPKESAHRGGRLGGGLFSQTAALTRVQRVVQTSVLP